MCWKSPKSLTVLDVSSATVFGCLSFMLFVRISDSTRTSDTCGDYYLLPMFPECDLLLEAIPCFNDTLDVIVTLSSPAGNVIHSFHVTFGNMTRLSLLAVNKAKHEGLIVTSNGDISLYVHKALGDSMLIYPVDTFSRDYETPPLTSLSHGNTSSSNISNGNGALYLFSPYNNTNITITSFQNTVESTSASPSSPTSTSSSYSIYSSASIKLNAFDIHKYHIDTHRRYRLHSAKVFAAVLVQTRDFFPVAGTLCLNSTLSLMDFVPPYSAKGKYFFIAFPNATDFRLSIVGSENTSLDLTTDLMSTEIILDQSGSNITDVMTASSSWVSASHPVTIYVTVTLCSNTSLPTSNKKCAESGFFLPSVENYFTCKRNKSKTGCVCACPSVFQRDLDPKNFSFFRNTNESGSIAFYPLLIGDIFDVTFSLLNASEFKDAVDVIATTNTSFIIFRYNMDNLNFLPGGYTLGTAHNACTPDAHDVLPIICDDTDSVDVKSPEIKDVKTSENFASDLNHCSCEFLQDLLNEKANFVDKNPSGLARSKIIHSFREEEFVWEEDDDNSARPLIAVIVSLCVSIFAVIAVISGYMLVEIMTRRKHVRNTKIRPFVS